MISLRLALVAFLLYFLAFFAYYRMYFRHRLYLLLLNEKSYMDHYLDRLPHMRERPEERRGMAAFMLQKRKGFIRRNRNFVFAATAIFVAAMILFADAV
jgi:hypothetical protein